MSDRDENGDETDDESGGGFDEPASEPATGVGTGGPGPDEQYCPSCGEVIKKAAEICPECGVRQKPAVSSSSKDRVTAGILAILLGWIGAHKFYLGETGLGILYLCFFWTGIPAIVGLIEGILYLTKTDEEFQRLYVND